MPSFLSKTGIAACLCGALAVAAQARAFHTQTSHTHVNRAQRATLHYRHAEILRRHLLAEPKSRRTPSQYASALNAYRAVYHGDPTSADAPKSVFAVAELLQIEGHQFHNTKDFRDARAQYEFLRQQYPASPLRRTALWAETEIARNDLHDQKLHRRIYSQRNTAQRNQETAPRVTRALFPDMTTRVSRNRVSQNTPAPPPTQDAVQDVDTAFVSDTTSVDTASADTASADTPAFDAAAPDGTGSTMARVLGLRVHRIVIDAGHGGHDSGTLGPYGLEEKNVVLDVALRLGKLLHERLGAQVIYTRRSDTFVPLQARTAIANRAKADLFLSIHANSSPDEDARGVETYFLNFTASPDALAVAARENAVSDRSVYELSNIVRKIALSDKIDESRTLAMDVQQSMYQNLERGNSRFRNRGVKKAPFVVLIGAHMPSILAEISFLTNTSDAAELRRPAYRQRIAESIYKGVAAYVESMGGVRIAENTRATE